MTRIVHSSIKRLFRETVDNNQEMVVNRPTDRYPPFFMNAVFFIINGYRERIQENLSCVLEGNAVFHTIESCFFRIPFEIV